MTAGYMPSAIKQLIPDNPQGVDLTPISDNSSPDSSAVGNAMNQLQQAGMVQGQQPGQMNTQDLLKMIMLSEMVKGGGQRPQDFLARLIPMLMMGGKDPSGLRELFQRNQKPPTQIDPMTGQKVMQQMTGQESNALGQMNALDAMQKNGIPVPPSTNNIPLRGPGGGMPEGVDLTAPSGNTSQNPMMANLMRKLIDSGVV